MIRLIALLAMAGLDISVTYGAGNQVIQLDKKNNIILKENNKIVDTMDFFHGKKAELFSEKQAREIVSSYQDGKYTVFLINNFGGNFDERYFLTGKNNKLILSKVENLSVFKEDFDLKAVECRKNIDKPLQAYQYPVPNEGFTCKTRYMADNSLTDLREYVKDNQIDVDIDRINRYLKRYPMKGKNIGIYNDIAFYLAQSQNYPAAIFILRTVIQRSPDRVVAYLNLADAYWDSNQKTDAHRFYRKYLATMNKSGKNSKVPERVVQRLKE